MTSDHIKPFTDANNVATATDAWKRFASEMEARRPPSDGNEAETFKARAIHRFDPRYAVEVLSSKAFAFFGLREVLFAGFCGWVLCPNSQNFIRRSMLAEALWQLQETERLARDHLTDYVFADVFARIAMIDSRFFSAIYHPLLQISPMDRLLLRGGGLDPRQRVGISEDIKIAISVLKVIHYHNTVLRNLEGIRKASLNTAYELAGEFGKEIDGKHLASRHVLARYKLFKESAAFAYAATSITVSPEKSLFDVIISQEANFEQNGHLLGELFGRAAYIRDFLEHCADQRDYKALSGHLGQTEAISMAPVSLSSSSAAKARTEFSRQTKRQSAR